MMILHHLLRSWAVGKIHLDIDNMNNNNNNKAQKSGSVTWP